MIRYLSSAGQPAGYSRPDGLSVGIVLLPPPLWRAGGEFIVAAIIVGSVVY